MGEREQREKSNLRYNFIIIFIYICGIILLCQLFNLQIVKGEEYRATSDTRLTRETTLKAARGSILDSKGNEIAGTRTSYTLELYNSKVSTKDLNTSILNMINVLESNGDKYKDTFPIKINPFEYIITDEELKTFKEENELEENLSAEQAFYYFKDKYEIEQENIEDVRKIIVVRYRISQEGYSSTNPLTIATDISNESIQIFNESSSKFSGIHIAIEPVRKYQQKSLASHILGYVGKINEDEYKARREEGYTQNDYIGKTGIEYVFEEYLKGEDGVKQIDMAVDGTSTGEYITKEAIAGSDVVLTIDANLQAVAEEALKNNIEKIRNGSFAESYDAKSGAVVVTNVKTGEILALVSYPDFEPELFITGISNEKWAEYSENEALFNRAVQGAYAPGSIFKMITGIAGLETGAITKDEKIHTEGIYQRWHKPHCWIWDDYRMTHGNINVSEAIKHSCNCFFYEVGYRMGIDALERYARYFGLGEKTGIELPLETSGTLASKTLYEERGLDWQAGITLSAAIGQAENNFSPIQMAKYISMLTNKGKNIDISIVKTIIRPDGTEVEQDEIDSFVNNKLNIEQSNIEDIQINEENLKAILEGMRTVTTEEGGTAYSMFKGFDIEVGGKTGSTENPNSYVNAWFAGFAPFDEPEISVVVFVENGGHGSYTAEVARDIMEKYFFANTNEIEENINAIPETETLR